MEGVGGQEGGASSTRRRCDWNIYSISFHCIMFMLSLTPDLCVLYSFLCNRIQKLCQKICIVHCE